jgi:hypothetical protein
VAFFQLSGGLVHSGTFEAVIAGFFLLGGHYELIL